jgi:hypothetical protein
MSLAPRVAGFRLTSRVSLAMSARLALIALLLPAWAAAQTGDRPFTVSVGQAFSADDNVLRLPRDIDPASVDGVSSRRDLISTTTLRAQYLNEISAQRINAWAEAKALRFSEHRQYDHLAWDVGARWNWEVGRQWYGLLSAQDRRFIASFGDQRTGQKSLTSVTDLRLDGGYRFTPRWSGIAGVESSQRRNGLQQLREADYRHTAYELGARYDSGFGNDIALLWRHVDGRYPNRQSIDGFGTPLQTAVDNGFSQDSLVLRLTYLPNDKSRISGDIGLTRHRLSTLSERNFSGPTAQLAYSHTPSDAWLFESYLRRDLGAAELINASFVNSLTLGGRLQWRPKGRLTVRGIAEVRRLSFDGDPGTVIGAFPVRRDRIRSLGLAVGWDVARNASVWGEWRRDVRSSNFDAADFEADVLTVTGLLKF